MNTAKDEYTRFAAEIAKLFGKDWDRVQDQVDASWKYMEHIPENAWRGIARLAAEAWESWPRNFPRSVKELYGTWGRQERYTRNSTDCEYCNGIGFFSASKWADVRADLTIRYVYTFRCKACKNWVGKVGTKIPALYPLEAIQEGYHVTVFPKPIPADAALKPLPELLESIGRRVNPRNDRPDVIPYREERSAWDNY